MYVTPKVIADLLSVSPQTVRRLAADGVIPSLKVGVCYRFIVADVLKALENTAWST